MEGYAYFADSDIAPVLSSTEITALKKAGEIVSNKYIPEAPLDIVYSEVPGTMNNTLVVTCSIADAEVRLYYNPEKVNSYEEARTKSLSVVAFGDDLYGIDVAKSTYLGQGKYLTIPKNLSRGNYTVIVEAVSPTQGVKYKRYSFSSSNLAINIPTETMTDHELVQLVDKAKTATTATIKDGTLVLDTNTKGVKIISYELDHGKETMVSHMDTKYDTGVMLTKGTHKVTIHISSIQQMGTGHLVMASVDSTIVVTDKDLKDAKQKELLKEANSLVTIAMKSMKESDVTKAEKAVAKLSTSSDKKELTAKLNSVKQAIEAKQVKEAEKAVQNAKKLKTKDSVTKAKKLIELIDVKATRTALLKELQKIKIK